MTHCPSCHAPLSSARICPLCGAQVGDEIPDMVPMVESGKVTRFPKWLYRVATWALSATGVLTFAIFVGGIFFLWPLLVALAVLGTLSLSVILVATFGPWPVER
jgi:hypothetical protein